MRSQAEMYWDELRRYWRDVKFDSGLRVGILAAHPDDETIGASVLLARCKDPVVMFLTDGAPKNSDLWAPHFRGSRQDYAQCRRAEAEAALSYAGVAPRQIEWFGGVDQEVIFRVDFLAEKTEEIMRNRGINVLVAHTYEGGHPDHDAAVLIASRAVSRLYTCLHIEMTSYHARDGHCETGRFLNANTASEFTFELTDADIIRKRSMLDAYASQRLVLENFSIDCERLRPAPPYDFASPPHEGPLWYEILGWPITGERWRKLASDSHCPTQVESCR